VNAALLLLIVFIVSYAVMSNDAAMETYCWGRPAIWPCD
jgi:hypothetical protein